MAKPAQVFSYPALIRVTSRAKSLDDLLAEAIAAGLPATLPHSDNNVKFEDFSAIDPSLRTEEKVPAPPAPLPGTSYAGLTAAQRNVFLSWSRKPENPAPPVYQQLYLANLEARLLEPEYQQQVVQKLRDLAESPAWAKN